MMASAISEENAITSLKIQVDNDISQRREDSIEKMDDELEEGEATESESEDEVEVNVIVDSQPSDSHKTKYALNAKDSEDRSKHEIFKQRSNQEDVRKYAQKENYHKPRKGSATYTHSRRHRPIPIIEQEFGSDMLSPIGVTEEKLEKRALRFGVTASNSAVSRAEWMQLWKSLDLTQDDFHRGGFRAEAIHMRGIESLRSSEIFDYFKGHNPDNIEWLNNQSCNIVFSEKESAAKALIGLSCPIIESAKKVNKNATEVKSKNINQKNLSPDKLSATKSIKKVKKKAPENKKSNSDSDSSSDDSSSSDSEDDGSSSDSSSSSNSSSSSSTSSSDSSSSSSSDSSDSEEDEINIQIANDKEETNNNSTNSVHMEVDASNEQQGTVSVEEVGVSLPPGRWRLGVPCPNTKALLLRYAHCKDKKMPGIEKPVDFYEEYISTRRSNKALEQERHRIQQELIDLERGHHRKNYVDEKSRSKRTHSKKEKIDTNVLKDVAGKNYVDLDNPYDEGKNPWGFLAQNWNKKETQDSLDYQALLHQHVTGQKRKRDSDSESDNDDGRRSHKMPSKRSHYQKSSSEENFCSYSEEESDGRDDYDDGVDWRSKITMPRMKMYADAEEKRKVRRNTEVKKRIRHNSNKEREMRSRVHFPIKPVQLKQPGFDLRAILQSKNLRKRDIGYHPNSDGE